MAAQTAPAERRTGAATPRAATVDSGGDAGMVGLQGAPSR
jgi:hypothetical protein